MYSMPNAGMNPNNPSVVEGAEIMADYEEAAARFDFMCVSTKARDFIDKQNRVIQLLAKDVNESRSKQSECEKSFKNLKNMCRNTKQICNDLQQIQADIRSLQMQINDMEWKNNSGGEQAAGPSAGPRSVAGMSMMHMPEGGQQTGRTQPRLVKFNREN